jgi:hypothetical protein
MVKLFGLCRTESGFQAEFWFVLRLIIGDRRKIQLLEVKPLRLFLKLFSDKPGKKLMRTFF